MRLAGAFLVLISCSAAAPPELFEIIAYEARGLQPIKGEIILPDAREQIPALLKSCGLEKVRTVDATDGVVLFRFSAPNDGPALRCVRQRLPAGTELKPAAFE